MLKIFPDRFLFRAIRTCFECFVDGNTSLSASLPRLRVLHGWFLKDGGRDRRRRRRIGEVSGVAFLLLYQASTKGMGLVEMVRLKIAAMEASRAPYSSSRSGSRSLLHDVDTHIKSGDTLAPDSLFPTPWACTSRRQT